MNNRSSLDDLAAFATIADEGSFTRAAAKLGVSQSALSHLMRELERRMGVRLLALRDRPAGTIRLTTVQQGYDMVLKPILPKFLETFPEIRVDVAIDDSIVDIVADRFDAGIRLGGLVEKDMIAVRVSPDIEPAVIASPAYFAKFPKPVKPQDLHEHRCINYRWSRAGNIYAWRFERGSQRLEVKVDGPLVFNSKEPILTSALDGLGLAYLFVDIVQEHLESGELVRVLEPWCPPWTGYHLYHSSRRQSPPALTALINVLRRAYREGGFTRST